MINLSANSSIEFDSTVFNSFRQLIQELTGIILTDKHKTMLAGRIAGRMKSLNVRSHADYLKIIRSGDPDELEKFANVVTTNLTAFFRENHHFEYLKDEILPHLIKEKKVKRRLRIWSAGCSTGEEPYSIAITLLQAVKGLQYWDCKILATDLDSESLAEGRRGVYPLDRFERVPGDLMRKWFLRGKGAQARFVRAASELRRLIVFNQLNLIGSWPMRSTFDVIFCRNVFIYFDEPTLTRIVNRMADHMEVGGHLFIGHSENLINLTDRFELFEKSIYRKVK